MNKIQFQFKHGLIFIPVTLTHQSQSIILQNCIFDTGAAGTTFDADLMAGIGLVPSPTSKIRRLATIGGYEHVFTNRVDELIIGEVVLSKVEVEIGDLTSKFNIQGIIGTDFIRLFNWELDFKMNYLKFRMIKP